jgi:hypothetical protein
MSFQKRQNHDLVREESVESVESSTVADIESKRNPTNSRLSSRMSAQQQRPMTRSPLLLRRPSKSNESGDDNGKADLSRSVDSLTKRAEYQQTSFMFDTAERAK